MIGPSGTAPIRLGLVGIGKIAKAQHLPAIADNKRFTLAATASPGERLDDVPGYDGIEEMIAGRHALDAVSLCTPPVGRHAVAMAAIDAGLHVMLEKPPAAALSEVADLQRRAAARGVTLFTTWHSRAAAGVGPARAWLAQRRIDAMRILWKEDIRRWHPGQDWILAAGGFGVFDPGINALSIVTHILPEPLLLDTARLDVPEGREGPIAAELRMRSGSARVTATFDFLQTGLQSWDIEVDTDRGMLRLGLGGSVLTLPGERPSEKPDREYATLYARFADLVSSGESEVDPTPLRLVADAFLIGSRIAVAPFAF
jgi:predicted dehydrogenase